MYAEVFDSFDINGRVAVEYGSFGVVVIYKPYDSSDDPWYGDRVLVIKPDGWMRTAVIGETKLEQGAPGFFLPGLTKQDVPVGTRLRWGKDIPATFTDTSVFGMTG